ncbi:hypothetical protein L226DRAFT_574648 [Lentinus tigrinus ALCF2SS1-7]|nr:hypothetical protein L226DRAFT_574648 [Lentinus tigrinus ALCF2SS1-7]
MPTVLTSHYSEKIHLSLRETIGQEDQNTRVTLREYLKQLHPIKWDNLVKETLTCTTARTSGTRRPSPRRTTSPSTASASSPQLLSSHFAINLLHSIENLVQLFGGNRDKLERELERMARRKFKFIVSMQRYSKFNRGKQENAAPFCARTRPPDRLLGNRILGDRKSDDTPTLSSSTAASTSPCPPSSSPPLPTSTPLSDRNLYKVNAAVVTSDGKTAADTNMVFLRGTLRNTQWVIGVVLFTGEDSKIVLNSGATPSKQSRIHNFINLLILTIMAIVCGIVDAVLEQRYFPLGAPWLYGDTQSDDNPRINGLIAAVFALIAFQNIDRISLYISIEGVPTCQALFIYFDGEIFYEKTGQATLARSWNLVPFAHALTTAMSRSKKRSPASSLCLRKTLPVYLPAIREEVRRVHFHDRQDPRPAFRRRRQEGRARPRAHFTDATLLADITTAQRAVSGPVEDCHGRMHNGFWTVLALCHTALVSVDPDTGAIQYKAQWPDEAALVQATADVRFMFRGRVREILILQTPFSRHGKYERFKLLNILDLTSARKRMSVILRKLDEDDEDRKVYLLLKGADNVIIEDWSPGHDDFVRTTEEHLAEFASEGLRMLTLSQYESWSKRYHEANVSLEKVEAVPDEIEHDLHLLDATANEDRLQDGVPEAIADLKEADIKIWVLIGDMLETAIAIGHNDNIIIIRGGGEGSIPVHMQMLNDVEEFFSESGVLQQDGVGLDESQQEQTAGYPRQRVNTGPMSSLVGHNDERPGGSALVIHGGVLTHVCRRVASLPEGALRETRQEVAGVMTLAIGDISMIQAADVGIGISSEEGLRAVNSSDYAIAQFWFLKRLLLVHGHWSCAA